MKGCLHCVDRLALYWKVITSSTVLTVQFLIQEPSLWHHITRLHERAPASVVHQHLDGRPGICLYQICIVTVPMISICIQINKIPKKLYTVVYYSVFLFAVA